MHDEQQMVEAHQLGMRDYREDKPCIIPNYITDFNARISYVAGYVGEMNRDREKGRVQ